MQLMLAQKCAECRPDAFQMQVPTGSLRIRNLKHVKLGAAGRSGLLVGARLRHFACRRSASRTIRT